MSTSDILTPWYASGDVDYNARSERSFSRLRQRKTPPPIPPKAFVPPPPVVERRVITDRKVPDFGWSVNTFP
ncbi:MAG: hypothetical protein IJ527_00205, partial [Prevotella sp.]|nr:hypothetical protein [Prevotella sp.]